MKLAIMQPYFMPYIGYFQLIQVADKFVFYDDVNFINRGWINRNRILVNGKDFLFSIPLKEASQNKLINEIYLSDDVKWKEKFLKTLEMAYKKAPFYQTVYEIVEKVLNLPTQNLSEWIVESFSVLNEYLAVQTQIVASSSIYQNTHLKAQERILDICVQEKATHYINAIGGVELYDKPSFENVGVQLHFLKTKPIVYKQFKNDFVPWLSIIDIMMFNDIATIQGFLEEYELG